MVNQIFVCGLFVLLNFPDSSPGAGELFMSLRLIKWNKKRVPLLEYWKVLSICFVGKKYISASSPIKLPSSYLWLRGFGFHGIPAPELKKSIDTYTSNQPGDISIKVLAKNQPRNKIIDQKREKKLKTSCPRPIMQLFTLPLTLLPSQMMQSCERDFVIYSHGGWE